MPRFSLIRPLDQPPGTRRLLNDLKNALDDDRLTELRLIVAYAKSGPLHRLHEELTHWRDTNRTAHAIFGIDQRGTSKEALELALSLFDSVHITQASGITFHPKIYLFTGDRYARAYVGSNNLTVGGTETNFETAVDIELDLPEDTAILEVFESAWNDLLPNSCPVTRHLTPVLLNALLDERTVIPEKYMHPRAGQDAPVGKKRAAPQANFHILPESPLPKKIVKVAQPRDDTGEQKPSGVDDTPVRGFAIQIKPHHNGEIFLSLTAATQNPEFFGWPFTGKTVPKNPNNPSYPQRVPDPVVNITVFGVDASPICILNSYELNTVYYEKKGEIRVTASPLIDIVPEYSVMIMERSNTERIDYDITIHTPDSPSYADWVAACNQSMPSGGKTPRKFGWF